MFREEESWDILSHNRWNPQSPSRIGAQILSTLPVASLTFEWLKTFLRPLSLLFLSRHVFFSFFGRTKQTRKKSASGRIFVKSCQVRVPVGLSKECSATGASEDINTLVHWYQLHVQPPKPVAEQTRAEPLPALQDQVGSVGKIWWDKPTVLRDYAEQQRGRYHHQLACIQFICWEMDTGVAVLQTSALSFSFFFLRCRLEMCCRTWLFTDFLI